MTWKKIMLLVALGLVLAASVVVKLIYFPSVKAAWFQFSAQKLRQVPGNLVIVRPTSFPKSLHKGVMMASVNGMRRGVGRNLTLSQLMAAAYNFNPARIALPPDAPTNNFDFLVTTPSNPEEHLRAAIRKKIGYVAHTETRTMDVMALKVVDASLPGLTVSDASEQQNIRFENRKINFQHMPLSFFMNFANLEQALNMPVVDKLGLTNLFDYSMAWSEQTQRQMRSGTMTRATVDKMLAAWGIGLQPDTTAIPVLVVEKVAN